MNNYAKNLVKNMKLFTHAKNGYNGKFPFVDVPIDSFPLFRGAK